MASATLFNLYHARLLESLDDGRNFFIVKGFSKFVDRDIQSIVHFLKLLARDITQDLPHIEAFLIARLQFDGIELGGLFEIRIDIEESFLLADLIGGSPRVYIIFDSLDYKYSLSRN